MHLVETSQVLKYNSSATACTRWRLKLSRASDVTQGKPPALRTVAASQSDRFYQMAHCDACQKTAWIPQITLQQQKYLLQLSAAPACLRVRPEKGRRRR